MKTRSDIFFKSFFISLIVFSLIAALIISSMYIERAFVDPTKRESNIVIGITLDDDLLCLCVLNCNPKSKEVTYLPIPDNLILEDGRILQKSYNKKMPRSLLSTINDLSGAYINKYLFISIDGVTAINDKLGGFEFLIRYPFEYNGETQSGNTYMTGEMAKSMFSYNGYDMTKVSLSDMGLAYLTSLLSSFADSNSLFVSLSDTYISSCINTDITEAEMLEYSKFFSKYGDMSHRFLELEGDKRPTSSNLYFIPQNYKTNKKIFK